MIRCYSHTSCTKVKMTVVDGQLLCWDVVMMSYNVTNRSTERHGQTKRGCFFYFYFSEPVTIIFRLGASYQINPTCGCDVILRTHVHYTPTGVTDRAHLHHQVMMNGSRCTFIHKIHEHPLLVLPGGTVKSAPDHLCMSGKSWKTSTYDCVGSNM